MIILKHIKTRLHNEKEEYSSREEDMNPLCLVTCVKGIVATMGKLEEGGVIQERKGKLV